MVPELQTKYDGLLSNLRSLGSVVAAYSGGVDSTFLVSAIKDSGIHYLAVTALSPTMPQGDVDSVMEIAQELQINHKIIQSKEMDDENFASNPTNRCYYCKTDLFTRLTDVAKTEGYKFVVDGSTTDDQADYRPGLQAKEQLSVVSPLIQSGLSKEDVRQLSKAKNLKTWNKPASPCLSSRITYGERITLDSLRMVGSAEIKMKNLGFNELRVRKQGETARIEVPASDIVRFMDDKVRSEIVSHLRGLGFLYVTLDLEGYQSGKLNRMVS
ncbi:MAG: ATP-dependent sacrificial sulfur transferase LarE [Magnetococcales bacterium]|nr:ATP-dependent sacrificial sulfur transferase LarE [Magnetococcales bacterium]NGZ27633.1 ATP-dependent sacrificial sulfur transferase LarE [Magnetococcales bacterium]